MAPGTLPEFGHWDERGHGQVGPERAVVEVARANCVDLHAVVTISGEDWTRPCRQTSSPRRRVLVRADEAGLKVIWMISVPATRGRSSAEDWELAQVLGDRKSFAVNVRGQAERERPCSRTEPAHDARVGDDQVRPSVTRSISEGHRGDGFLVGDVDRDRVGDAFAAELERLGGSAPHRSGRRRTRSSRHPPGRARSPRRNPGRRPSRRQPRPLMARSPVAVARTSKDLLAGAHDDRKLRLLPREQGAHLSERARRR